MHSEETSDRIENTFACKLRGNEVHARRSQPSIRDKPRLGPYPFFPNPIQPGFKLSLKTALNASAAPKLSKLPEIEVTLTWEESSLRLRNEIRKRIARIDLTFQAEVLGKGFAPSKNRVVAKVNFVNGAVEWAVIEPRKATLLKTHKMKPVDPGPPFRS
jgi:hypothetical protein